jgi:hypothetical protein
MGYTKIVQFGDTTEIYEYENDLHQKKGIDTKKATILAQGWRGAATQSLFNVKEKRKKMARDEAKRKGQYKRPISSIKRSTTNFFRLVHHNNCIAETINFITLTFSYDISYRKATYVTQEFFRRLKKDHSELSLSFISVPERTKKGRYHFHLLVYNLPPETASIERKTRNIQRKFQHGYVDVMLASKLTTGIAGYMAKYMAKSITDESYEAGRSYSHSRGIEKPTSAGSNSIGGYISEFVDNETIDSVKESEYNVPYLGKCRYKKIINKNK